MRTILGLLVVSILFLPLVPAADPAGTAIFFQAHRGGLDEVPENTLPALHHAWSIPGAVPEVDLRTTQDGEVVILHDETPERTTDAPAPWATRNIRDIPLSTLRTWDAGRWFDAKYAGTPVPTLMEVLALLKADPGRQLYLDLKDVDTETLIALLKAEEVTRQVIFVHGSPAACVGLSQSWPGARTMTWLSGEPEGIQSRFRSLAAGGFTGISQIQLHLRPKAGAGVGVYALDDAFLQEAVSATAAADVTLQIRPFTFDAASMGSLIGLGVHWYVADAPAARRAALDSARGKKAIPVALWQCSPAISYALGASGRHFGPVHMFQSAF